MKKIFLDLEINQNSGLMVAVASLLSGVIYCLVIAPLDAESVARLPGGELCYDLYRVFVLIETISGISYGVWHYRSRRRAQAECGGGNF